MSDAPHAELEPIVRDILQGLGLATGRLEAIESFSHAVWLSDSAAIRYHVIGPVGRLEHEAEVAAALPPAARYPRVIAVGRHDGHDWMVTERARGVSLPEVWPALSPPERERAVHDAAGALRAIHGAPAQHLEPPCLYEGAPVAKRSGFLAILRELAATAPGPPAQRGRVERLIDELEDLGDTVAAPATVVMTHGDFNLNQFVYDPHTHELTAVLDLEMSHAESRDWDVVPFLWSCADPVGSVPTRLEARSRPGDYVDAPRWLRAAYPELFATSGFRARLRVHQLIYQRVRYARNPDRLEAMANVLSGHSPAEALLDRVG